MDSSVEPSGSGDAHPEVLVTTEWVAGRRADPKVRIVESDEAILLYEIGHIPGAVKLDWHTDLQNPVRRVLQNRGAIQPYLVCAHVSLGLARCA